VSTTVRTTIAVITLHRSVQRTTKAMTPSTMMLTITTAATDMVLMIRSGTDNRDGHRRCVTGRDRRGNRPAFFQDARSNQKSKYTLQADDEAPLEPSFLHNFLSLQQTGDWAR
jgi:hypothetical protein